MTLGEKLVQLRRARGLSQEELADAIGVSRQAVNKWELDNALPDLDRLVALSAFYGVTTDYLLQPQNTAAQPAHVAKSVSLSPETVIATSLACTVGGLLLMIHGRFVSASSWPSIIGLLLQIFALAPALGFLIPLSKK